jgi:hypothetical protein
LNVLALEEIDGRKILRNTSNNSDNFNALINNIINKEMMNSIEFKTEDVKASTINNQKEMGYFRIREKSNERYDRNKSSEKNERNNDKMQKYFNPSNYTKKRNRSDNKSYHEKTMINKTSPIKQCELPCLMKTNMKKNVYNKYF